MPWRSRDKLQRQGKMPWCGIENPLGAQNCFLNSIVQVLWHLTEFKKVLFCAEGTREHVCVSPHCLLCTLRDTLREYGRASEKGDALSVEALRQCLHVISEGQFAIGMARSGVWTLRRQRVPTDSRFVGVLL